MQKKEDIDNKFRYAIALTGGIATGKSTVSNLFKMYGFLVIDADKIAHKLLDMYSDTISKMFGTEYVQNQKVLRPKLANLIFNNLEQKRKLEKFLHPLIKDEIIRQSRIFEQQKKPYFIDIPLFFENKNYAIDKSVVVYCDKQTQLQRLIQRDKISKELALAKINSQMDIEEKKMMATFVIDNTKDLKNLQNKVDTITKKLIT